MITSDFKFNNMTNINEDSCALTQNNLENMESLNYNLKNFFPECPMEEAISFATQQPNIFVNGSHQVGINGCNINQNSQLRDTPITRPPCRINLLQRPFATVPFLGRGRSNVNLESNLREGTVLFNNRSTNPSTETSFINYTNYPLIPSVQATTANASNLIEIDRDRGWVRGGLSARNLARDENC